MSKITPYPVFEQVEEPIAASLDGKRNAYTFECAVLQNHQNFAACMHKVAERKKGALAAIFTACSVAIGKKQCPAIAMRKAEIEKGVAIYFVERRRMGAIATLIDKANDLFRSGRLTVAPTIPSLLDGIKTAGYAEAINERLAVAVTGRPIEDFPVPLPPGTTGVVLDVHPGETPLQAARRILALNEPIKA